jgi:hypothetical protein
MTKFSNDLTDAQLERLAILSEEMGEAQQAIGKILRHGYHSWNPTVAHTRTNRDDLARELGHVHFAIDMLSHSDDVDADQVSFSYVEKEKSIKKWLHHQS